MEEKILHLTLSKKPFEVMVTKEKQIEFRKPSDWIKSRLFNEDGSRKEFDVVRFTNGYGPDRPFFVSTFGGFYESVSKSSKTYSNGLKVIVEKGDFVIYLGEIIRKGNLKS